MAKQPHLCPDEYPWIQDSGRVKCLLNHPDYRDSELSNLIVQPRTMVASHAMVMADRATGVDDRFASGRLGLLPLLDRVSLLGARDGEVQRGAGWIDMRHVTQDHGWRPLLGQ